MTPRTISVPRALLIRVRDELALTLEADPGCEHSVGVCSCELRGVLTEVRGLLCAGHVWTTVGRWPDDGMEEQECDRCGLGRVVPILPDQAGFANHG